MVVPAISLVFALYAVIKELILALSGRVIQADGF
jgi:hypothetical protein